MLAAVTRSHLTRAIDFTKKRNVTLKALSLFVRVYKPARHKLSKHSLRKQWNFYSTNNAVFQKATFCRVSAFFHWFPDQNVVQFKIIYPYRPTPMFQKYRF